MKGCVVRQLMMTVCAAALGFAMASVVAPVAEARPDCGPGAGDCGSGAQQPRPPAQEQQQQRPASPSGHGPDDRSQGRPQGAGAQPPRMSGAQGSTTGHGPDDRGSSWMQQGSGASRPGAGGRPQGNPQPGNPQPGTPQPGKPGQGSGQPGGRPGGNPPSGGWGGHDRPQPGGWSDGGAAGTGITGTVTAAAGAAVSAPRLSSVLRTPSQIRIITPTSRPIRSRSILLRPIRHPDMLSPSIQSRRPTCGSGRAPIPASFSCAPRTAVSRRRRPDRNTG